MRGFWIYIGLLKNMRSMDDEQITSAIAKSLDQRHQLLKILSMNHYDLEETAVLRC